MSRISAETVLAWKDADVTKYTEDFFEVYIDCDDGEALTTNRHLQYLHGFLHFNRKFGVPIRTSQILPPEYIATPKGHKKLMESTVECVYDWLKGMVPKHEIAKEWTKCIDAHNTSCILDLERFSASIDAEDVMELILDPFIAKERTEMKGILASDVGPDIKSIAIENCNVSIMEHIRNECPKLYPHNGIVQHVAVSSTKEDQLCQFINVIGYVTEIDSEIKPIPIAESLAEGLNYIYTYSINAGLGKKAVMYNKSPIALTETLNRLIQHMASQIENIHVGDCGSTLTSDIVINRGNVDAVVGMYAIIKGKVVKVTSTIAKAHLGLLLHLRTAAGCKSTDKVGLCSTCGGAATLNLVPDYTVGGSASSLVLGRNSQLILKTKHSNIISFSKISRISKSLDGIMDVSDNGKDIYLEESCRKAKISFLAMPRSQKAREVNAQFLHTVHSVNDFDRVDISSFTNVPVISIEPMNGIDEELRDIRIKAGTNVYFTKYLLEYVRDNHDMLELNPIKGSKLEYTLDLSKFDIKHPLFTMPFKHFDSLTLHNQLEAFFMSVNDRPKGDVLTDFDSFGQALNRITEMTYKHLGVGMSTLQMMLIPFTMEDPSNGDYSITRSGDSCHFGKLAKIRNKRSLSVVTIAQGQGDVYGHLHPLINDRAMPHQYDGHFVNN